MTALTEYLRVKGRESKRGNPERDRIGGQVCQEFVKYAGKGLMSAAG